MKAAKARILFSLFDAFLLHICKKSEKKQGPEAKKKMHKISSFVIGLTTW